MDWSDPQVVLTAIGVAIAFLYTLITVLIWHATCQNTKATRKVLEAEYRPYVEIRRVEIHAEALTRCRIDVTIQNVGTVPSRRIEIDFRIGTPGSIRETFAIASREPIALFPDQPFTVTSALSPEEMKFLHKNKELKVLITVGYEGATDKKYTTDGAYTYSTENDAFVIESGDWK